MLIKKRRGEVMSNFLPPAELAKAFVGVSKAKAGKGALQLLLLGILAGVFIGFAAHLATTVATGNWVVFGLKKFFIGAVFSVGLMLVIIPGSELWTGNNLMFVGLLNKDISLGQLLRNWGLVFVGNFIGSIMLAWFVAKMSGLTGGAVGGTAINIAYGKIATTVTDGASHNVMYFFRAIGCNWLVCLAVMMAVAAKDIGGKVLAIFFPIMAFVTSGFEHVIANMYFIPAGIFSKSYSGAVAASGKSLETLSALNWGSMWTDNLLIVTLGNFVGGAIFTAAVYWWLFVRDTK